MNRRKFLGIVGNSIIAAAAAPAIVKAENIMRVKPIVTLEELTDDSLLSALESAYTLGGYPIGRSIFDLDKVKRAEQMKREFLGARLDNLVLATA